jgi:hypothetical protein
LAEREVSKLKTEAKEELLRARKYLSDTDWICSKCYEQGLIMKDIYPIELAKRIEARLLCSNE